MIGKFSKLLFIQYNSSKKNGNVGKFFNSLLEQHKKYKFFDSVGNEFNLLLLHDKFNKVAGEAKVKIEKGETIEVEMKQMKDILQSVKKTWGKSPEMVYYGTKTTDGWQKLIDKELATKIESDPEGPKKLFDAIMKSSGDTWKPIKTEIAAFFKVWPFRMPGISKSIPMKYLPLVKTLGNYELERVVNFVVFQDARTWDEMYEALLVRGSKISLLSNTVGRMMIGSYVIPAATATLINITKAALTIVEAGMNLGHDIISSNSGWRFDIVKYNQEGTWGGFGEEWCKEYYSRIPHSFKQILDWKNYTLLDDMGDFGKYIFSSQAERDDFIKNPKFKFDFQPGNVDDKKGLIRIFRSTVNISPIYQDNAPKFIIAHLEKNEGNDLGAIVSVKVEMAFEVQVGIEEFRDWVDSPDSTWRYSGRIECVGEDGLEDSDREEYEFDW